MGFKPSVRPSKSCIQTNGASSRYPHESALAEIDFFVIDLGCASCSQTFRATATSAALTGPDVDWEGPFEAPRIPR